MDIVNHEGFMEVLGTGVLCLGLVATLLRLFLRTRNSYFSSGSAVMSLSIGITIFLLRAQRLEVHSELEVFLILLEVMGGSCFLLFLFLFSKSRRAGL